MSDQNSDPNEELSYDSYSRKFIRGNMPLTLDYVTKLFENLSNVRRDIFFDNVIDDIRWTVMGTHSLAGAHNKKDDFLQRTFERLGSLLKEGSVVTRIEHVYISGDAAIVEMTSTSIALNGRPYAQSYYWITRFVDGLIVEVRAYLNSVLVQQLIEENERTMMSS